MIEEWRPVVGYEGFYEVSNLGRIKSLERFTSNNIRIREHIQKQQISKGGYMYVPLRKDGVRTNKRVHRLVAVAFIPNPEGKPQVNHIDEDKLNNSASNLEWVDGTTNINHGTAIERAHRVDCSPLTRAVLQLTPEGKVVAEYPSQSKAAAAVGTTAGNISNCCKGRAKTVRGYVWKYKE